MADKSVIAYCKVNPSFIYYFGKDVSVSNDIDEVYGEYLKGNGITATGLDNGRGLFIKNQASE
jgi:hypothetical protein